MNKLTRRKMLQQGGLTLFGAALPSIAVGAGRPAVSEAENDEGAAEIAPAGPLAALNRSPRSVQEYYVRRVREAMQEGDARRAALHTKADAERYVADVRKRLRLCFGPMPEKTPLNARVTRVQERDGYRLENVIYESRPGFLVTANLHVPTGRPGPFPGVLVPVGHFGSGKVGAQTLAQGLVRQGYVTLAFDPIGQGERYQYVDADLNPMYGRGTGEHIYSGMRMPLVGETLPAWFLWDCVRSLDLLLERPEVDARHLGITGSSGGGNQTKLLCGFDSRVTMAAPSCNVTSLRRIVENERPLDPENLPWGLLAHGLDHSDFLAAMAPRPVMLLGQENDFFDARGFEEACDRLRALYKLLGAEQNFAAILGTGSHGFSKPNREAMYGWFNRWSGISRSSEEPNLTRETPEDLQCTPRGQVAELKSTSEFSHGRDLSAKLRASRPRLNGTALADRIVTTLKLPARKGVPEYRIMTGTSSRGYPKNHHGEFLLETEPDIQVFVYRLSDGRLLSRPPRGPRRALLYVSHRSADVELRTDPWLKELCASEPDAAIYACDLRGMGESQPGLSTPDNPLKSRVDNMHAGFGVLFDYPTAGQRTFDLLRILDWLGSFGHEEVHLVARGWGAVPGTFAGILHDRVVQVTLKHALTSYADVAETRHYDWPWATLPPGVLQAFDLPDCYRELERKKLRRIEPASAGGVPA
ncbi:MAG: acetylxylan esterase [Opitutaceae bacterium]|nr:acetylxylan esterase [Opitutaceae bacterium]